MDEHLLLRFDEIDHVHSLWLLRKCTDEVKNKRILKFLELKFSVFFLFSKDRHQATNMTLPTLNESQGGVNHHHTLLNQPNVSLAQISMMNSTLPRRSSILTTTVAGGTTTTSGVGTTSSPNPSNLLTNPRRLASMAVISYEKILSL